MANLDLLEWFDEDERELCPACGKRSMVGVDEAPDLGVCLGCAAVWVAGARIDKQTHLDVLPTDLSG